MQTIEMRSLEPRDKEALYTLLSKNDWPYHSGAKITRDQFEKRFTSDFYTRVGVRTFVVIQEGMMVGYVRIFDLGSDDQDDETPLFDLRIASAMQGKGIGTEVVQNIVAHIFENYPNKQRIEATTRNDNLAMRSVLSKCLFVKEAHYRRAWNSLSGKKYDAIGYGILREDWDRGEVTELEW